MKCSLNVQFIYSSKCHCVKGHCHLNDLEHFELQTFVSRNTCRISVTCKVVVMYSKMSTFKIYNVLKNLTSTNQISSSPTKLYSHLLKYKVNTYFEYPKRECGHLHCFLKKKKLSAK